ncbi:asparagine synthase [Thauera sinica]|nr:asparagine synthase [Thauera sp. K11]
MLAAEGLTRGDVAVESSGTAVVAAGRAGASIAQDAESGCIAAVLGRPRWTNPEAADVAALRGDAAAAIAHYRRHGHGLLADLHGSFALVIADPRSRKLTLAVDRSGAERLCFARVGPLLVFSTSARSVARHPAIAAPVNRQALFEYLYCHMVPSPDTAFAGVEKLLPAECLELEGTSAARRHYWHLAYDTGGADDDEASKRRFIELVQQAVARQNDVRPTGAFLSGGTDSSTVSGMLGRIAGKPADTFSIGFDAQGFDELEYARITSKHFGTRAHEYYVTPDDVAEAIPLIAAAYDEPFGNASAAPTYFCAKLARENGIEVVLAGDGGDEFFGGNARYAKQGVFEHYHGLPSALRRVVEPLILNFPLGASLWPVRKAQSYVRQARIPLPDRLETYNFLHRDPLQEIFEADFLAGIDPDRPLALMREAYFRCASPEPVERMMHLDHKFTLADNDLRKVSRMCEAAGVEVRFPFLDDDLVAFSGTLRTDRKVSNGRLRVLFKDALRGFLPDETIAKSKHGFGLPFGVWLDSHGPLQALANDALASLAQRGIIRPAYLERLREAHASGHASYYGVMIWVLVQMELWLRHNA